MTDSIVSPWVDLVDRFSQTAPQPDQRSGGSSYSGGKVTPDFVVNGLVDRGIPRHIAEGFVPNVGDESGFNPGINEIEPLVPGSRGGFGLIQWTGPRRKQLERFAEHSGTYVADPDMQLDFLAWELQNTEKGAYNAMLQTKDRNQAASVIVNRFLRPHETYRNERSARYLQGFDVPNAEPAMDFSRLWLGLGE